MRKCVIEGCERDVFTRDWCNSHYISGRKDGTIQLKYKRAANRVAAARFRAVPVTMDCMICGRPLKEHGVTEFCLAVEPFAYVPAPTLKLVFNE